MIIQRFNNVNKEASNILNIKKLREEKGVSRYHLSKLTGISQSTLRSVELDNDNPGFLTVKRICKALNVKLDEVREVKNDE